jgi:hypothetical protein
MPFLVRSNIHRITGQPQSEGTCLYSFVSAIAAFAPRATQLDKASFLFQNDYPVHHLRLRVPFSEYQIMADELAGCWRVQAAPVQWVAKCRSGLGLCFNLRLIGQKRQPAWP